MAKNSWNLGKSNRLGGLLEVLPECSHYREKNLRKYTKTNFSAIPLSRTYAVRYHSNSLQTLFHHGHDQTTF